MSGTKAGGLKTSITNKERYGADFYRNIGRKGGMVSSTGGFASKKIGADGLTGPERARIAGAKGGFKSHRGPTPKTIQIINENKSLILAMRRNGFRFSQICKTIGVPPKTLERWLEKQIGEQK